MAIVTKHLQLHQVTWVFAPALILSPRPNTPVGTSFGA